MEVVRYMGLYVHDTLSLGDIVNAALTIPPVALMLGELALTPSDIAVSQPVPSCPSLFLC